MPAGLLLHHHRRVLHGLIAAILQTWLLFYLSYPLHAFALGDLCAGVPLGPGTADAQSPYWFETIKKQ